MRRAAECPYHVNGEEGGVGLGPQDHLNGRYREVTHFHETNVLICESMRMVPDVESCGGLVTVSDKLLLLMLALGLEANESPWA